jgi:hypothetical protein
MTSRRPMRLPSADVPPDIDDTVMATTSSSASTLQPVKEAGQGDASRDTVSLVPPTHNTDVDAEVALSAATRSCKRLRTDELAEVPSSPHIQTIAPCAAVNNGASASSSVVSMDDISPVSSMPRTGDSTVHASDPSTNALSTSSTSSSSSSTKAIPPPLQAQHIAAGSFVPVYIGRDKLLREAHIDNRRTDAVYVEVKVNANFPTCPVVDGLQYRYSAAARLHLTATLLGDSKGLSIHAPSIPRILVGAQTAATEAARSQLNPAQRAWLAELGSQASANGALISDKRGKDDDKVKACNKLWEHLEQLYNPSVDNTRPTLWPNSQLTSGWSQILAPRTSILRSNAPTQSTSKPSPTSHYTYELALHGATPEAAYIVACVMANYGLLRLVSPELTENVTKVLTPASPQSGAESTDSSDEDGEWQRHRGSSNRAARNAQRQAQHNVRRQLSELTSSPVMLSMNAQYNQHTTLPLLALSTTVSLRPVLQPYISCLIDNWQSLGCNIHDLEHDAVFKNITQSRVEFRAPHAHWAVDQRIGNAVVGLWIREENKELLAQLNDIARPFTSLSQASLRIACTMVQKSKRGRINYNSAVKIFLTEPTKVSPPVAQQRLLPPPALSPTPAPVPGSYVARVLDGVRRAQTASLNHRPRKTPRTETQSSATPPASSQHGASSPSSSQQHKSKQYPSSQSSSASTTTQPSRPNATHKATAANTSRSDSPSSEASASLDARLAQLEARLTQRLEQRMNEIMEQHTAVIERMTATIADSLGRHIEAMFQRFTAYAMPPTHGVMPSATDCKDQLENAHNSGSLPTPASRPQSTAATGTPSLYTAVPPTRSLIQEAAPSVNNSSSRLSASSPAHNGQAGFHG